MARDLKILSEHILEGVPAEKGVLVCYSARFFLHRGAEVTPDFQSIARYDDAVPTREVEGVRLIEHHLLLGKRRAIAGVEQALLGMTPGSYREVRIPPHLGYGSRGLGELIPPNALLTVKLWVHDIQPDGHG